MYREGEGELSQHRGKCFTIYIFGTSQKAFLLFYLTLNVELPDAGTTGRFQVLITLM